MRIAAPVSHMWLRNCVFVAVCLAGAGLVGNTLLRRERVTPPRAGSRVQEGGDRNQASGVRGQETGEFAKSVSKLNATFRDHWKREGLQPAARADHLAIARRLSLALVGTVPSLEEIR